MVLMRDLWNFSFFGRGDVSLTHSNSVACFGVIGKTPQLISSNNFVKKIFVCVGHRDNVLARCDSIFPLLRCHTTFSFQNPLSESKELQSWGCSKILLPFLMRFDSLFCPNQQQQLCLPPWMATSLIIFYQLPSVSKSRIPSKNI